MALSRISNICIHWAYAAFALRRRRLSPHMLCVYVSLSVVECVCHCIVALVGLVAPGGTGGTGSGYVYVCV